MQRDNLIAAAAALAMTGGGHLTPRQIGDGTKRRRAREADRTAQLAIRHKDHVDDFTRQQERRFDLKTRKHTASVDRRAEVNNRVPNRPDMTVVRANKDRGVTEPRGLGWVGHLHSVARAAVAMAAISEVVRKPRAKKVAA